MALHYCNGIYLYNQNHDVCVQPFDTVVHAVQFEQGEQVSIENGMKYYSV